MDRVSIRMVKEPPLLSEKPITGPGSAIEILNDYLGDFDREVMAIVNLRTDGKPINMNIMSMGTINASLACPRGSQGIDPVECCSGAAVSQSPVRESQTFERRYPIYG